MITFLKRYIKSLFIKKQFVFGDINLNSRKGAIHKAWGHIFSNHLFGDYVEFGIYKGETFFNSISVFREFKSWLKGEKHSDENWRKNVSEKSVLHQKVFFHALDTFEGMPANNEKNFIYQQGNFMFPYAEFKKRLDKQKNDEIEMHAYKGTFKNTSDEFKKKMTNRKVSIVNFDCDLEQSTTDALNVVKDFIQIGTILLFDDYNAFNANQNQGQRKSFSEFNKKSDFVFEKYFSYHYSGQSFLCVGIKK